MVVTVCDMMITIMMVIISLVIRIVCRPYLLITHLRARVVNNRVASPHCHSQSDSTTGSAVDCLRSSSVCMLLLLPLTPVIFKFSDTLKITSAVHFSEVLRILFALPKYNSSNTCVRMTNKIKSSENVTSLR